MKGIKRRWRKGFTIIEILAVLTIVAVLAAVTVPSILAFTRAGQQTNRDNIARTIYLAAQNRLTELRITKRLVSEMETAVSDSNKVYGILGRSNILTADEYEENKDNVYYISKPKDELTDTNLVVKLLEPVLLDKNILNEAILIEFNIETGIVLSVFYGDRFPEGMDEFFYDTDEPNNNAEDNIFGTRAYDRASRRNQGYYGIGETGSIAVVPDVPDVPAMPIINVYDSYSVPLPGSGNRNVLYASILIPTDSSGTFNLLINGNVAESGVNFADITSGSLTTISVTKPIYPGESDIADGYSHFIWVLDYVDGTASNAFSIERYKDDFVIDKNKNLNVGITDGDAINGQSFTEAHPYFFSDNPGDYSGCYTVRSARHLYNIRMVDGVGNFTQKDHVDLQEGGWIADFAPIPQLSGNYTGTSWTIKNLNVTTASVDADNNAVAGLFGTLTSGAVVTGLTLENPNVTLDAPSVAGSVYVGAVCGLSEGTITGAYVRFTDADAVISGTGDVDGVGGIVGINNRTLTDSVFISPFNKQHVSGVVEATTGGMVGINDEDGVLKNLLFLALAPEETVGADVVINPITGTQMNDLLVTDNLYYLSGNAVLPETNPAGTLDQPYNVTPLKKDSDVGIGIPLATDEMYIVADIADVLISGWKKLVKSGSSLTADEVLDTANTVYPYPYADNTLSSIARYPGWPIVGSANASDLLINVYDSFEYELPKETALDGSLVRQQTNNTLYAKIYVPKDEVAESYDLFINGEIAETLMFDEETVTANTLLDALKASPIGENNTAYVYACDVDDSELLRLSDSLNPDDYACFIWVLDYVGGDMVTAGDAYSIDRYHDQIDDGVAENLYVGIGLSSGSAESAVSWDGSEAPAIGKTTHPYYLTEYDDVYGEYTVMTARHLHNLRYSNDNAALFKQGQIINLFNVGNAVGNFAPIPLWVGSYDGAGFSIENLVVDIGTDNAGLFEMVRNGATVKNITLVNPDVSGANNVGGVSGTLNGTAENITLVNPSVTGGNAVGGVCGTLNGTVKGVYVRFDADADTKNESTISGGLNVGGIAGEAGTSVTLMDAVVISPNELRPVSGTGGSTGGIIGSCTSTTNIRNVLYLARAPLFNGNVRPINGSGTVSGNTDNSRNLFYLSGKPIRPRVSASLTDYNREPLSGAGVGIGTYEMYLLNTASWTTSWSKKFKNGTTELSKSDILEPELNDYYPYPFVADMKSSAAVNPHWPIVEGISLNASFTYYEMYDNDSRGFDSSKEQPLRPLADVTSSRLVAHDGYAVELSPMIGNYQLEMGEQTYTLTGSSNAANPTWTLKGPAGSLAIWPNERIVTDRDPMFRFYIPNNVTESLSPADGSEISVVIYRSNSSVPLLVDSFNPLFAPADLGLIRSPRHIDNIDHVLGGTYQQQMNVDFSLYSKELINTSTRGPVIAFTDQAVVKNSVDKEPFTGTFDGNGRLIKNVLINAPGTDGIGLFEQIGKGGTVKNVTLQNATITGQNTVGGIAGKVESGAMVTGCKLYGIIIKGNQYIGGIAGKNSGEITHSLVGVIAGALLENTISGDDRVGGIAGVCTGTIEISYVDYSLVGKEDGASTNVGGIAGRLETDDSRIRNVFYNYGKSSPQTADWKISVRGKTDSTGGLVGFIDATVKTVLSNAYTDAFFGNTNTVVNVLIGGRNGTWTLLETVLYLRDSGYNGTGTVTAAATNTNRTAKDLRTQATVDVLNGTGGTVWKLGSGALDYAVDVSTATTYTYPQLANLKLEPQRWPLPSTAAAVSLKYYEIYKLKNPKTNDYYGIWSGDDDLLDYRPEQTVLEDGYILATSIGNGGAKYMARSLDGKIIVDKIEVPDSIIISLGTVKYCIFDLDELTKHCKDPLNVGAIYPIHVTVGQGNAAKADYFDGYINPLFAKSIYSLNEMKYIGSTTSGKESTVAEKQKFFSGDTGFEYVIRTPRHINNIKTDASTLNGHFTQEIDVDFGGLNDKGYLRNNLVIANNGSASQVKHYISIHESVVPGTFTGTYNAASHYDDNGELDYNGNHHIKSIKNMTLPNPTPKDTKDKVTGTYMDQPQPGNIGIFSEIGASGVVENLILENNSVSGTTGNVGGLAGVNKGTIKNIFSYGSTVTATTGKAGGIAGTNNKVISNVVLVSDKDVSPVTSNSGTAAGIAADNSFNAAGEAADNSVKISNALYIARAPGNNPITATSHPVDNAFYLSGTVEAVNGIGGAAVLNQGANYNNLVSPTTDGSLPRTAQELSLISLSGWTTNRINGGVMSSMVYPYPYLRRVQDSSFKWPVATVPAVNVNYYEKYEKYVEKIDDGDVVLDEKGHAVIERVEAYRFYPPKAIDLPDQALDIWKEGGSILESGYCVIMPDSYGSKSDRRTVGINGRNGYIIEEMDGMNVVRITNIRHYDAKPLLVTVNDMETGLYINPLFAQCVYYTDDRPKELSIRTPEQMLNIDLLTDTSGLTFNQERDLDFDDVTIEGAGVVSTLFMGTFDGKEYKINNVSIIMPDTDNVGLFSLNGGIIKNVKLGPDTEIIGRNHVGGIVGYNLGADEREEADPKRSNSGRIEDCVLGLPEDPEESLRIVDANGEQDPKKIAGSNDGVITGCKRYDEFVPDEPETEIH